MDAAYPLKRGGVGSLRIVLEIRLSWIYEHDTPIRWERNASPKLTWLKHTTPSTNTPYLEGCHDPGMGLTYS